MQIANATEDHHFFEVSYILAFYKETSHLICKVNQMTGFYIKCNAELNNVRMSFKKKFQEQQRLKV